MGMRGLKMVKISLLVLVDVDHVELVLQHLLLELVLQEDLVLVGVHPLLLDHGGDQARKMLEVLGDVAVVIGLDVIDVLHDVLDGGLEPLLDALRDDVGGEEKEQQRGDDGKGDEKKDQPVLEAVPGAALVFFQVHFQDVARQDEKKGQAEEDDDDPQAEDHGVALQGQGREVLAFLEIDAQDDEDDEKQHDGRHDQAHALDVLVFHSPSSSPPAPRERPDRPRRGHRPFQFSMIAAQRSIDTGGEK